VFLRTPLRAACRRPSPAIAFDPAIYAGAL